MAQTIGKTLIVRLFLMIACVNVAISATFYFDSLRLAETEFQSAIQIEVEQLANIFTQQLWLFDLRTTEQLAIMALNNPDIEGISLHDQKGDVLFEKGRQSKTNVTVINKELRHQSGVVVGELDVAFRNTDKDKQEALIFRISIITVLATLMITILYIVYTLNKHLVHPLKNLQEDMNLVAEGTFQKSQLTGQKREIQAIINGFNRMAESLSLREREKNRLENELRQKYKMEAIGTMAGGIAHDFNNLLSIIIGNIELLKRKWKAGGDADKHIVNIKGATDRAAEMVNQILAFSRSAEPQLKDVELKEFVSGTMKLLRSTTPTTVEIESCLPDSSIWIKADKTQLQQILINLCTNAVHAMDERGKLHVSLSLGLLPPALQDDSADNTSDFALLSVKDTGSGMDKETISKIFDPFFTTKEPGKGTGMGLSMVHGIISQHNGFISVESTLHVGSEFKIYFPVSQTQNIGDAGEGTKNVLPSGTGKILLVDDEAALNEANAELLTELGYEVSSVTNSEEALNVFRQSPKEFDLVITDQTMPKLSGAVLATKILEIEPDTPVILTTGYSSKVTEEDAMKNGIRAYLHKPLSNELLAKTVREILYNRKPQ